MRKTIYVVVACFILISLEVNAQQVTHTKSALGAPIVVNLSQAAEYDRLHPKNIGVHQADPDIDEDESTGTEPVVEPGAVKNDVHYGAGNERTQGITSPAPSITFTGDSMGLSGTSAIFPPDINGVAGLTYILQTTNAGIVVLNKSGTIAKSVSLATFFPNANPSSPIPPYDPHCAYDPNNNVYIVICSGFSVSTGHGGVLLAVSETGDPTGNWWEYFIDGTGNTSDLFDYPLLGFNSNWIVVTGNLYANFTTFTSCKICVIDRAAAYNGSASGALDVFSDAANVTTIDPAKTIDNGVTTEWMVENSTGSSGGYGYVKLATVTGPVSAPVYALGSQVGINQPWSNTVIGGAQKGGAELLNLGDARIRDAVYRNGSMWFAHHVFMPATTPNHSSIDWWQINPATQTVIQFSRIDDPGDTLFYSYPGIDVNASSDVLISMSMSSSNIYPGAAYAFHSHTDAANFTESPYEYKAGLAYYYRTDNNGNDRWGDFTGVSSDPVDGTFWSFSEWACSSSKAYEGIWGTDIAHVNVTPDTNCNAPVALDTTNLTQTSVTLGWTPISQTTYFTVQYRKVGASNWITDTTSSTSYNVTGLTASTNYQFEVLNNCKSGSVSPYSSIYNFTTAAPCATQAGFNAPVSVFCSAPATVNFSNSSTNAAFYYWTFGDGGSSTDANPTYTYNNYGYYTVTLIATGCTVDTVSVSQYIDVDSTIACVVSLPNAGAGPVQTGCIGQLYDSGGPSANYPNNTDASITIAPLGAASVSVSFGAFHMEPSYDYVYVYDGPDESYPLLGKYTGTALPNGGNPITSSGGYITIRQTSDDSINYSGFALTWQCTAATAKPVAAFTADVTTSCSGIIQFNDLSTEGPTTWLWNFGDGNTSTLQNPLHAYLTSGTFTVMLTATNSYGSNSYSKTNYISVNVPTAPVTSNPAAICSGSYTELTATGSPTLNWYDAAIGGNLIGSGSPLITPPLFNTTTYYVESDQNSSSRQVGPIDYTIGASAGAFIARNHYFCQYFDCYTPLTLTSVVMYSSLDESVKVVLVQNGDTIQSANVNVSSGIDTVVTLNFNVPVGTNLELGTTGNNIWINSAGASYPYTIPNVMSITGNNGGNAGYYYYFYDWIINAPCSSGRVPVVATVDPGPAISFTPNLASNYCTFTNNTTGATQYSWNFGDPGSGANNVSTLQGPTHIFSTTGTFNVCLKATDATGCKNTVCQNVIVLTVGTHGINNDASITVYPNPVSDHLTIEFGNAYAGKKWMLKMTDILGNAVAEKDVLVQQQGKYDWDLTTVSKGVYILILQSDDQKLMKKIIRQ